MMLLNDHVAGTSSTLGLPSVERNSPSAIAGVALTIVGEAADDECKRSKWTRHRGGEWTLNPGILCRQSCDLSSPVSVRCQLRNGAGFCWWGPRANIEDRSSLIINWSSGSHKRSTNWANHINYNFGGGPYWWGPGAMAPGPPKSGPAEKQEGAHGVRTQFP